MGLNHATFNRTRANTLIGDLPIYVLDPNLKILAMVPAAPNQVGKVFSRNVSGVGLESILAAAQVGDKNYYAQSIRYADGTYVAAMPLRANEDEAVIAIVVYQRVQHRCADFRSIIFLIQVWLQQVVNCP